MGGSGGLGGAASSGSGGAASGASGGSGAAASGGVAAGANAAQGRIEITQFRMEQQIDRKHYGIEEIILSQVDEAMVTEKYWFVCSVAIKAVLLIILCIHFLYSFFHKNIPAVQARGHATPQARQKAHAVDH